MANEGDRDVQKLPALQTVRGILEAVIVAALLWTGNTLIEVKTTLAVVQTQLLGITTTLADVPGLKEQQIKNTAAIAEMRERQTSNGQDIQELRKLKGMR